MVRGWAATWRVTRDPWPASGPCLATFWHRDILVMVALHQDMTALVSLSSDGGMVAGAVVRLGHRVVRGSSSRGGGEAMITLREALRQGRTVALALDGPRGPAGVAKPGAAALAAAEGVPFVVGEIDARGVRLRSWDRMLIPWPFARVHVRYRLGA